MLVVLCNFQARVKVVINTKSTSSQGVVMQLSRLHNIGRTPACKSQGRFGTCCNFYQVVSSFWTTICTSSRCACCPSSLSCLPLPHQHLLFTQEEPVSPQSDLSLSCSHWKFRVTCSSLSNSSPQSALLQPHSFPFPSPLPLHCLASLLFSTIPLSP